MMKKRYIASAVVFAMAAVCAGASTVYDRLYTEFTKYPNRIVGSENLDNCFKAVEKELAAAGITTHRQTFPSLVQRTSRLSLKIDGVAIDGAMMPDKGISSWALPEPVSGQLVYAGSGSISDIDGLDMRGSVAVLDLRYGKISLENVFVHGAQAVIFVGDKKLSQWSASQTLEGFSVSLIPSIYMDAEAASAAGIAPAVCNPSTIASSVKVTAAGKSVSIDAKVGLEDTVGCNLWALIPGKKGWTGGLGTPETVILSAVMDTYGFIPENSPDNRRAANAALLADVACELAKTEHERSILVVFFGSNYAGLEGARHFFYAVEMADKGAVDTDLDERQKRLEIEFDDMNRMLGELGKDSIFDGNNVDSRAVTQRCKRLLLMFVNRQRGPVGDLNRRLATLSSELDSVNEPVTDERRAEINAEREDIRLKLDAEALKKEHWSSLRSQIAGRRLEIENDDTMKAFEEVRAIVKDDLERRKVELASAIRNNRTSCELSDVFIDQNVIAHFEFDFSASDKPWLFSIINSFGLFRTDDITTGSFSSHFAAISKIYAESAAKSAGEALLFDEALSSFYKPFSLCIPLQRQVSTAAGITIGIAGFQMMTLGDQLLNDGMPYVEKFDLSGLKKQMTELFSGLTSSPLFSLRSIRSRIITEPRYTYLRGKKADSRDMSGFYFQNYAAESKEFEGIAQNAVAVFAGFKSVAPICGQSFNPRVRIESNGYIYMPYIARNVVYTAPSKLYAFGYDESGALDRVSVNESSVNPVPLFYQYGGLAFGFGYAPDPLGGEMYIPKTMTAVNDSVYKNANNVSLVPGCPSAFFVDHPDRIKRIGGNGEILLGSTEENPTGIGVELTRENLLNLDATSQEASDYWILNNTRLKVLRSRNIISDDLESLHADAKDHLDAAKEAQDERFWSKARAHFIFAINISNRVYGPLRGITEDLVQAVIVLLLLNIPFAFAMERLVFGFPSIYKQVLGFIGFFIATFLILFFTHPAFSLASAPIIIFLAFVIILLSVLAIYIVMGKIKKEIRAMQGLSSTVHGIESDSSTSAAAVLIGISGMRNRPLKTFLTAITVVLLTFTILVFASFTSKQGIVENYIGKGADADRIELHRSSFLGIDNEYINSVKSLYGDRFEICCRGGLYRDPTNPNDNGVMPLSADRILMLPRTGKTSPISAIMGVETNEMACNPAFAALAEGFDSVKTEHMPIFLSTVVAESLGAVKGDLLLLNGEKLTLAGFTDSQALQTMGTIDDFKVTPPDYAGTSRNNGGNSSTGMGVGALEEIDPGSFEWFAPENVALARMGDLRRVFGHSTCVNMLVMYPKSEQVDIEQTGREIAPAFHGAVHTKSSEGARKMFFSKLVEGSGFGDVVVPLLLGGLIIFSSLMGSIVDREKEIFTYSALGLSPPDVGALFFAESAVYSVIGGMGGYLLSQLIAKFLSALGRMGIITPPEMNFSSLTSVSTILIVMAVVMLSTIYPALKAGKSANPGVSRKWKMPAPDGDKMRFVFPFTVSELDFAGILSFVNEHFSNHSDATLGSFAAKDVKLFKLPGAKGGEDAIGIEANISLAPFDLGIFQHFRMYSSEFEIQGIDEVVVELDRLGGTPPSWIRSNRAFAAELRQQFLLWRSLPIETIEYYRSQTEKELGGISKRENI